MFHESSSHPMALKKPPLTDPVLPSSLETPVDPKQKALSIIDALPGNSLISKTGYITLGTGLATYVLSKEIYVLNEETLVLVAFAGMATLLYRGIKKPFNDWAAEENEVGFISNV